MADPVWLLRRRLDGELARVISVYTDEELAKKGMEEAKRGIGMLIQNGVIAMMTPDGPVPAGVTVLDFVRDLGISNINHGYYQMEPHGSVVVAASRIILPNN